MATTGFKRVHGKAGRNNMSKQESLLATRIKAFEGVKDPPTVHHKPGSMNKKKKA